MLPYQVWINHINSDSDGDATHRPPFDTVQLESGESLAHMSFSGREWYLVRRDAGQLNTGGKSCSGYDQSCWDAENGDN
eukprot:SAG31_NODE_35748_length_320_cov_0.805430_1_plen_78_part_01